LVAVKIFDIAVILSRYNEANSMIKTTHSRGFNVKRLRTAVKEYRATWALANKELVQLCRKYPGHHDRSQVNAKLLIVGRSYATGIERKIESNGSQGNALFRVADHFIHYADEIDKLIKTIPSTTDKLSKAALEPIITAHGKFVLLLAEVTRDEQSPRSFASKYLHFHRPIVPVYDGFAARTISKLARWQQPFGFVPWQRPQDWTYHRYVMRLWQLCEEARKSGEHPTVKEMDSYVLFEAER
jgi:hypothetical protein